MSFRINPLGRLRRDSHPGLLSPEEEHLQEEWISLQARLGALEAELEALRRLVATPQDQVARALDQIESEAGNRLGGGGWQRIRAWFLEGQ